MMAQAARWAMAAILAMASAQAIAAEPPAFSPKDYSCWRGPHGSGAVDAGRTLVTSAAEARVLWKSDKQDLPPGWLHSNGRKNRGIVGGYCGPVVAGGRVFLYYYQPSGAVVDEEVIKIATDKRREKWRVSADDVILCLDADTGRTLWATVLKEKGLNFNFDQQGPLMQPAVVGDRVFAMGTAGRVYCLKAETGALVWEATLGKAAEVLEKVRAGGRMFDPKQAAALNSCPAWADGVVVCNDHSEVLSGGETADCGLVAFDAGTGRTLWTLPTCIAAVSSPIRWEQGGKDYIVAAGPSRAVCVEPRTGWVLWEIPGPVNSKGTPAVGEGHLVLNGTVESKRSEGLGPSCYRITPEKAEKAWSLEAVSKMPWGSALVYRGRAYVGKQCVDLATGRVLGKFGLDIPSPVAGDGRVIAGTHLYDADTGADLGSIDVPLEPFTTTALADGRLYVRGPREPGGSLGARAPGCVWCVDLRAADRP